MCITRVAQTCAYVCGVRMCVSHVYIAQVWPILGSKCTSGRQECMMTSFSMHNKNDAIMYFTRSPVHNSCHIQQCHARQNYNWYRSKCTRVTISRTLNQFVHLLLEYFCDDASAYGPASLPKCESLVDLQGNIIFEGQCQRCVITGHHHLLVCDT